MGVQATPENRKVKQDFIGRADHQKEGAWEAPESHRIEINQAVELYSSTKIKARAQSW